MMLAYDAAFVSLLVAYKLWRDDGMRLEDGDFSRMDLVERGYDD